MQKRVEAAVGLAAALAALSCGGGNVASELANKPDYQPENQTKCQVAKSQERPLVVEWPSGDRADLEVRARQGLVVVSYEGCEMTMLPRCKATGEYAYAPVTTKQDTLTIRDEDELYAAIPAGAARFEAKLAKSGQLNVAMTLVGKFVADRVEVKGDELEGDCEGATHVVVGLSVGAFEFFAGADAEVGAGVKVAEAGIGASSRAKRETLTRDGDVKACDKASVEDKSPPANCGASIRLEVVELRKAEPAKGAGGTGGPAPKLECPAGTAMTDGMCKPKVSTDCPDGMLFQQGQGCIPKVVTNVALPTPGDGSPSRGPASAPVVIHWFGEYQDPFTKRVAGTLDELEKEMGSKIRIVWRNAPLAFHTKARPAAYAAMEAYAQKGDAGFWNMHGRILAAAPDLDMATLEGHARAVGLDMPRFKRAMESEAHKPQVDRDFAAFNAKGFRGVPTFAVGAQVVTGSQPIDKFRAAVNAALGGGSAEVGPPPSDSPSWGPANAPVVIEWFGDYQSPFNKRVAPALKQIEKEFPGKVRFVWRSFPLDMFPNARSAQLAVLEANAQGKFKAMHELLTENPTKLNAGELVAYAQKAGVDSRKMTAAISSKRYDRQIERDIDAGKAAGVRGVPAFRINGKLLSGAQPVEKFRAAVREALH